MDEILKKMKWPFATGISSPIMTDKNEDIMSKFDTTTKLLLKLYIEYPFKTSIQSYLVPCLFEHLLRNFFPYVRPTAVGIDITQGIKIVI